MTDAAVVKPVLRGWIHAAATPVALVAAVWLMASATTGVSGRMAVGAFGASLVGLYGISALYHVPRWSAGVRYILSRFDVAMIPLFIAGTFTPVAFFSLSGGWRTWSIAVAWIVAITGSAIAASPVKAPRWVGAMGYIGVGWLTVLPITQFVQALPWEGIGLISLGGLLYTLGAVVYARRWPNPVPHLFGFHEVFHLFVVAASVCHYIAIWQFVLPVAA